jgi:hypothetical protein
MGDSQSSEPQACSKENGRAKQAAKIRAILHALHVLGYRSAAAQAGVLGLSRSTAWAAFHARHDRYGLSAVTLKRMLDAPTAPDEVRQLVREYIAEKLRGEYGHNEQELRAFRQKMPDAK